MSLRRIVHWIPVLVWMCVIFLFSSDTQSFQHSSRILEPLLQWLFPGMSPNGLHTAVFFIRKCCHMAEYALLAVLVWNALSRPWRKGSAPWCWRESVWALTFVTLFATSDELHQLYVPGRQGTVADVLVDTLGGALGLLLMWAAYGHARRWSSRTRRA